MDFFHTVFKIILHLFRGAEHYGLRYITEPSFNTVSFTVMQGQFNGSKIDPGYFFLDPSPPHAAWGPQIYDAYGELVWHGSSGINSQDLHVCNYQGQTGNHLCFHSHGPEPKMVVLDNHYQLKAEFSTRLFGSQPNGHEFNMVAGGNSFLQAIQLEKRFALEPYIRRGGTVSDCCFQEIDIPTGSSLFDWCFLDHLPLWTTTLFIETQNSPNNTSPKAGEGTQHKPWDFCHINSIDKADDDYLISARHSDQLIKIAGPDNRHGVDPGSVLWRLGGAQNDFIMDFRFTRQHHARFLSVNTSTTIISLLNNAWEGTNRPSASASAGQILQVNNKTMEASILQNFEHPLKGISSGRGSMQLLANRNILIGWGRLPEITEYNDNSLVLYHARMETSFKENSFSIEGDRAAFSYRTYKFPWVGEPYWKPKVKSESAIFKRSTVTCWVSWNGSTEVTTWRIFWTYTKHRERLKTGTFAKKGFETTIRLQYPLISERYALPLIAVEALDKHDRVLATAVTDPFFVIRLLMLLLCVSVMESLLILLRTSGENFWLQTEDASLGNSKKNATYLKWLG